MFKIFAKSALVLLLGGGLAGIGVQSGLAARVATGITRAQEVVAAVSSSKSEAGSVLKAIMDGTSIPDAASDGKQGAELKEESVEKSSATEMETEGVESPDTEISTGSESDVATGNSSDVRTMVNTITPDVAKGGPVMQHGDN